MEKARREGNGRLPTLVVRAAPGKKSRAIIRFGPLTLPAAIGRNGRTVIKREGDGATPIAAMRLLYGFRRGERNGRLASELLIKRIRTDMMWCDQPDDPNYNRLVKAPFKPSHEEMKRKDGLYDICLVLDWNVTSRARNRGSAIFFHLARPGYEPTAGCVAISARDMRRILPFLRKGTIVQVT
ncbi:L,D-peptidoglycan transpeptidase YkuD (ErfK/YbiS/YcfS/YnhG family) [Rhizobium sp. BK196]|jgi:L,D-peptidoglycan transpeptidase YkuD (ErfK/YbiS/YcfS/YnhG family)|uniref:L,D-transpeptidase family protein n=1 Tax=Rhizobium sp. BK196 TaxID=2587073 RepID=UPI00161B1C34|nr:L,D-transpeptidase [Rhizobium sp. BK196]MBB3313492.1 L,D-peptidoglycan transpeptidase YkuD (ErfK/YbiS/YcfS/YnhG family) [Rhizobium sp. BK196]